jgi:acetyltransferase-like isoleucine patch superfamily enzyme
MSDARTLVIVGEAPLATLALTIGVADRGAQRVRVVELAPDRIAEDPLDALAIDTPETTDAFAAIGVAALNFARFDLWAKLRFKGFRCPALVHPRAFVDPSALLGDNVLVGPGAVVEPGAKVGRGTIVGSAAVIGTGSEVGPWCWLASRVVVGAGSRVGAHTVLGGGVHLADRTEFAGPGEIDVAGSYHGRFEPGTFIASGFPYPGVRLMGNRA